MPMRIIEAALVPVLLSGVAFAQRGTLEVLATDWRGEQIRRPDITVTSVSRGIEYKPQSGRSRLTLEHDLYRVRVEASGFNSAEKIVGVYSGSVLSVISLTVGGLYPRPSPILRGQVLGFNPRESRSPNTYVRLIPLFGQESKESRISKQGTFEIVEYIPGDHLLVVVVNGQIRSTQRVDLIKHQEHVEVDLTKQPSAP